MHQRYRIAANEFLLPNYIIEIQYILTIRNYKLKIKALIGLPTLL
jgi:hypothetical protein